jgi:hypothetical protein
VTAVVGSTVAQESAGIVGIVVGAAETVVGDVGIVGIVVEAETVVGVGIEAEIEAEKKVGMIVEVVVEMIVMVDDVTGIGMVVFEIELEELPHIESLALCWKRLSVEREEKKVVAALSFLS